ncbi:MAG: phosphoglycerate dehydrogenase [Clostridia bacterium]|nr:phosphoglycerate dehydrogenase [Clostridia bacterium]
MKNIKLMNKIAKVGTDIFDKTVYEVSDNAEAPVAMMVRSAALHDLEFNPELLCIARCGAGVNNIPVDRCAEEGIVVFNTPGANANGVKELTIAALMLASRNIVGGVNWATSLKGSEGVAKQVEAGKSKFAGTEIAGKSLGVIGLGAIGGMVANAASALGMQVYGCDPFITVNAAWNLSRSIKHASSFDEIFKTCDYITLHVPATNDTKGMINKDTLSLMKDGVKIINLARADLVNSEDMKAAIASGKVSSYVVDFPTDDTVGVDGIVTIPHLGASTAESEDNCAVMAAKQLVDFLENGNIVNSVNYPNVSLPHTAANRACIMHKNIPGVLSQFTTALSEKNINIENLANGSKGEYAYTIIETNSALPAEIVDTLKGVDGVIKVIVL